MWLQVVLFAATTASVFATPAGFAAFFAGEQCPQGWSVLPTTEGRLIQSVADAANAGVTVNSPLKDQEDRIHTHSYSTVFPLPSKSVAAIDCCNDEGACHDNYPIDSSFNETSSGLPFVQLLLCVLKEADENEVPIGTIAFFDPSVPSCPENFSSLTEANGRFIVGGYATTGVILSDTAPLASGEDRPHAHEYSTSIQTSDVSYAGVDGCCNSNPSADGQWPIEGNASSTSSGLPYIQLLTCVSQAPTFSENFPPEMMMFNEVACPPGWTQSFTAAGRFIVALPENGVAGATFGGPSFEPGFTGNFVHSHPFEGSVTTRSCGVGLAAGCCGDGYAANKEYLYNGVSDKTAVDLPYLSAPLCVKTGSPLAQL